MEHVTGLRGLAILLVLVFHLDPRFSEIGYKGYLGVEMFFVISGYFLLLGMQREVSFAFIPFCCKKLKRLFVPLAFLVSAVGMCSLLMPAEEMKTAAETGLAALLGGSNVWLGASEGGYFDVKSAENPLLHTWYLGALCQMFIVCGLGALLLKRAPRMITLTGVALAGGLSFLWGNVPFMLSCGMKWGVELPVWYTSLCPNYYDALPRLWQLLAGGLVMLLPLSRYRVANTLAAAAGVWLIFHAVSGVSVLPVKDGLPIYGICAVLGTVLLLRFLPGSYCEALFCLRPLKWVGKLSFSLYLCHLPLWVFVRWYGFVEEPSLLQLAGMLVAVFPLAMLFYAWVEQRRMPGWLALGGYVCAFALCALTVATDGLKGNLHVAANSYDLAYSEEYEECCRESLTADYPHDKIPVWEELTAIARTRAHAPNFGTSLLQIGDADVAPTFALIGDSHATSMFPGMHRVLKHSGCSGVFLAWRYVPASPAAQTESEKAMKQWLQAHPEIHYVVLAQRWSGYMGVNQYVTSNIEWLKGENKEWLFQERSQVVRALCKELKQMGKEVIIMTEVPIMNAYYPLGWVRQCLIFGRSAEDAPLECSEAAYDKRCARSLAFLQQLEKEGLCRLLHLEKPLRAEGIMKGVREGRTLYYDDDHLNADGAVYMMQQLKEDFLNLLRKSGETVK